MLNLSTHHFIIYSVIFGLIFMSWMIYRKKGQIYKNKMIYFNAVIALIIGISACIFQSIVDLLMFIFVIVNYIIVHYSNQKSSNITQEMYNFMTMHDHLTQLPNRYSLTQYIAENLNEQVTFLHINLDQFKLINTIFGYQQADILLTMITQALKQLVQEEMRLFRISGDELLLIIEENDVQKATELAKNILKMLQQPFYIENKNIFITSSIGIAVSPQHGKTLQELLIHADTAMLQVKKQGRNNYHVYDVNLEYDNQHLNQQILSDLYIAHQNQQLVLHYQAKFDVDTQKICGVEALMRWQHPEYGLLYPKDFIHISEKTGVIIPMTYWVLEEVCQQIQKWKQSQMTQFLPVAINISNVVFEQEKLLYYTEKFIKQYDIQAHELVFEITETVAIRNIQQSQGICKRLHGLGVRIVIDDFGIGYSNFMYLKDLMIDELKVDKSFLKNIEDNHKNKMILKYIIELAKQLNLMTTVEGVETQQQLDILKKLSCQYAQGFYLAKPMTLQNLQQLFKN